jgi:hypothetical protein
MMKTIWKIFALAALHFIFGIVAFFIGFSLEGIDTGQSPTATEKIAMDLVTILWTPFLQIAEITHIHGGNPLEWLLFFSNSLLWGAVLYGVVLGCFKIFRRRHHNEKSEF